MYKSGNTYKVLKSMLKILCSASRGDAEKDKEKRNEFEWGLAHPIRLPLTLYEHLRGIELKSQ